MSFISVRKAAALAVAELGVAAFFIAGVTRAALGESAAWFVLAAVALTALVRAIDIESWAVLILAVSSVACVTPSAHRRQSRGCHGSG